MRLITLFTLIYTSMVAPTLVVPAPVSAVSCHHYGMPCKDTP